MRQLKRDPLTVIRETIAEQAQRIETLEAESTAAHNMIEAALCLIPAAEGTLLTTAVRDALVTRDNRIAELEKERDEAIQVRDLARTASQKDLEAKRAAEAEGKRLWDGMYAISRLRLQCAAAHDCANRALAIADAALAPQPVFCACECLEHRDLLPVEDCIRNSCTMRECPACEPKPEVPPQCRHCGSKMEIGASWYCTSHGQQSTPEVKP